MAYPQDSSQLEKLLTEALIDPSLRQAIDDAGAYEEELHKEVIAVAADIWASAAKQISDFDDAERNLDSKQELLKETQRSRPYVVFFVEVISKVGYVALVVGFYAAFALFSSTVRHTLSAVFFSRILPYWVAESMGLLVIIALTAWLYGSKAPQYKENVAGVEREIERLKGERDKARAILDDQLKKNGIAPVIRETLNRSKQITFPPVLPEADTSGLAEVLNARYEITTPARLRMVSLMERMQNGSIGIAGPRGAGKTTLLWKLCEEAQARPTQISLFTSAPIQYEARDFLLYLFISVCNQVIKKEIGDQDSQAWADFPSLPQGVSRLQRFLPSNIWRQRNPEQPALLKLRNDDPRKYDLVLEARRILRGLRFQQSYSAGWSGSLKFHIAETGLNAAVQLAQRQLTLPELVDEYNRFLEKVTARYERVVIAIDELDKLESDEAAEKFVNGIKAIFQQPKVFYLVSVSENAMSGFERRGLPFRDAFDSAFDDVVKVQYLDFKASARLLSRRLYPAPSPVYIAFCHVLCGGLPRDLIRQCRRLYEYARANPGKTYSDIYRALIKEDVAAKLAAARPAIQRLNGEADLTEIIEVINTPPSDAAALLAAMLRLKNARNAITVSTTSDSARDETKAQSSIASRSLLSLHDEFIVYLYLALAMWNLFERPVDQTRWETLVTSDSLEQMAGARQWMAVDSAAAIKIINGVLSRSGMPTPPFLAPAARSAAAS